MPKTSSPIRVGVVGVGAIGALHARIYARFPRLAKLVAVYDVDAARAKSVARQVGCRVARRFEDLVSQVQAASVCVPTSRHHTVGTALLEHGIPVLIEKPIAATLKEADDLLARAARRRLVLQVGHLERFNAAIQAAQQYLTRPRFIEAHRLSPYPFRGTDVSVVLDLMIHDLDLVLSLVKTQPGRIDALGVAVLSGSEDIANARLVFPTGCVANLTASRVSDETIRRIRLFQEDGYLSIDYHRQTAELARKLGRAIRRRTLSVKRRQPLDDQLVSFLKAVRTGERPLVSGTDAREALALALKIEQTMRRRPVRRGQTPLVKG